MADWRAGYRAALLDYIVKRGGSPDWRTSRENEAARRHMLICAPAPASRFEESTWEDWNGTLAETPFTTRYGLDGWISCTCGEVQGLHLRLSESIGDILLGLLSEEED